MLIIGIGGSALGPQFVAGALGGAGDQLRPYFFDNTDPDGMDRVISEIGAALEETLDDRHLQKRRDKRDPQRHA